MRYKNVAYNTQESLLNIRKELITKALHACSTTEDYSKDIELHGYTILRAARDGLLQLRE